MDFAIGICFGVGGVALLIALVYLFGPNTPPPGY
jgi:hypothetical protein